MHALAEVLETAQTRIAAASYEMESWGTETESMLDHVVSQVDMILGYCFGYTEDSIEKVGPAFVATYKKHRKTEKPGDAYCGAATAALVQHGEVVTLEFVAQCYLHAVMARRGTVRERCERLLKAVQNQHEGGIRYLVHLLLKVPLNQRDHRWQEIMHGALEHLQNDLECLDDKGRFYLCSDIFFALAVLHERAKEFDATREAFMRMLVGWMTESGISYRCRSFLWTTYVQAMRYGYPRYAVVAENELMRLILPFDRFDARVRGVLYGCCVPHPQMYSAYGTVTSELRTRVHEHCLTLLREANWTLEEWAALARSSEGSIDGVGAIVAHKVEEIVVGRYSTFPRHAWKRIHNELMRDGMTLHAYARMVEHTIRPDLRDLSVWAYEQYAYTIELGHLPIFFDSLDNEAWRQMVAKVFDVRLLSLQHQIAVGAPDDAATREASNELKCFRCYNKSLVTELRARVWSDVAREFLSLPEHQKVSLPSLSCCRTPPY